MPPYLYVRGKTAIIVAKQLLCFGKIGHVALLVNAALDEAHASPFPSTAGNEQNIKVLAFHAQPRSLLKRQQMAANGSA